jgi:hypothetical protein
VARDGPERTADRAASGEAGATADDMAQKAPHDMPGHLHANAAVAARGPRLADGAAQPEDLRPAWL